MKRNQIKYIVDIVMYVALSSIAVTGLILGYVIPPGGGGRTFLGLHRHDWGNIHLDLAWIFMLALGVHLFLNWSWVCATSSKVFRHTWKRNLVLFSLAWIVVLAFAWLVAWF